jgi:ABC-2 type transport system permease protein
MVNGFRYGFLGVSDVPVTFSLSLLVIFNVVLFGIAYYLLKTGKGIRS